jgi:hypothetical protein
MTTALTPPQALGMLGALQTEIRDAAVLSADGDVLAGAPGLSPAGEHVVTVGDGDHTIVVDAGPGTLRSVLAIDLQTALHAMSPDR